MNDDDAIKEQMANANTLANQLLMELGQLTVSVRNGFIEDHGLNRRVATAAVRTAMVGSLSAFMVATFGEEKQLPSSEREKMHMELLDKIDDTIKDYFLSKGASIIASTELKGEGP